LDNLTHSLVGLFLARAGFKHVTPRGTAILIVAANAPDFDTPCFFFGPAAYIHWHRNITHSLIALPFMALLSVAVVRWISRTKVRWVPAFWIATLGVASHLILDLTNAYGVRLLLPFSGHWTHWDLTPVVDLAIWAILLLGVVAPWFGRLVGSEIGETRRGGGGGWAVLSLLLLTGYDYGREVAHDRAVATVDSRIYNGLAPRRVGAFPNDNPLVWKGVAELSNAFVVVPVDLRKEFRPEDGMTFFKPPRTLAMQAAMITPAFQAFLEFVQWPVWVLEPNQVRLVDLRFGTPNAPGFEATAVLDNSDHVVSSVFGFGPVSNSIQHR
jgi:inner membrane protein